MWLRGVCSPTRSSKKELLDGGNPLVADSKWRSPRARRLHCPRFRPPAVNFINRIVEVAGKLRSTPQLGRVVPEFGREDLRELLFRGYRIVYLLKDDAVTILRVVHGGRDLADLVRREPWQIGD
jgi:plasmid stabilization system protein ParE